MSANLLRPVQAVVARSAARGGARQLHQTAVRNQTFTATDAVMPKPNTSRITGYVGITLATSMGIFTGAQISKNIASFLEENELFIPSDDDDDD